MTAGITSAGAVIFRESRGSRLFLLLHYPSGHWDFVKGRMEPGETTRQTTIREAVEETGISDLEFVDGFEKTIRYEFRSDGQTVHKKVIFYLAKTQTSRVALSHEHLAFTWLNFKDAIKKTTYDGARSVLAEAERLLAKT